MSFINTNWCKYAIEKSDKVQPTNNNPNQKWVIDIFDDRFNKHCEKYIGLKKHCEKYIIYRKD